MNLRHLVDNFVYVRDRGEHWQILTPSKGGKYRGDCEDFSLTALYLLEGSLWNFWKALIFRKAKICFCKAYGGGHAVLRYEGKYIDNIERRWCTKEELEAKGYKFSKWLFIPYQVALKLIFAKFNKRKQDNVS